jgi:hypothetical protein
MVEAPGVEPGSEGDQCWPLRAYPLYLLRSGQRPGAGSLHRYRLFVSQPRRIEIRATSQFNYASR